MFIIERKREKTMMYNNVQHINWLPPVCAPAGD